MVYTKLEQKYSPRLSSLDKLSILKVCVCEINFQYDRDVIRFNISLCGVRQETFSEEKQQKWVN